MPQTAQQLNPTRLAKQAAIRRASAKARRDMNRFDGEVRADLKRIYKQTLADLSQAINAVAGDGSVKLQSLQSLLSQASRTLDNLENGRDALLSNSLNSGATVGTQALGADAAALSSSLTNLAEEAVRFTRNFIHDDGLQLSDRIWRIDNHARQVVKESIEQAVIQGHSATQAAEELLGRGGKIPQELINKMGRANAKKLMDDIKRGLMTGKGSPMNNAMRLFRTEINRAHGEAYHSAAFSHPDVIGSRFLLSPNHPRPDICDMHARVNRFGLGSGVYPKGKSPWPAHPNTLSYTEVVFDDEVSNEDRQSKQNRIDWLNEQSIPIQERVLGSRKKRMALDRGILTENQIKTPWKILEKRYQRKGLTPDRWRSITPLNPVIPSPANQISPVSAAFEVKGHKDVAKSTLDAIDSIHSDGKLPIIPIKSSRATRFYGAYVHYPHSGKALDIRISNRGTHKSLTLAHEIGHFIDHQAIGDAGRFASSYHPVMESWWQAIQKTDAYQQIDRLIKGPAAIEVGGEYYRLDKKHLRYLRSREELWARSYAQYIAEKSTDATLKNELKAITKGQIEALVSYPSQWQPKDFKAVSTAIDALMETLQWQK